MNRTFITSLLTCISITLSAQKTDKESVTYNYLRNPLEKLDASIKNYDIEVVVLWIEKEKQRRENYQSELARLEQEYQVALEAHKSRSLQEKLLQTAIDATNNEIVLRRPQRKIVEKPIFIPFPDISVLTSKISLDGYSQGNENAILIKVEYHDIYASSPVDKKEESKANDDIFYIRSVTVKQPVEVSLISSEGSVIYNEVFDKDAIFTSKKINKEDWENFLKNRWQSVFDLHVMAHYDNLAKGINKNINSKFGYSKIKRTTNLYMGKGKKYSYETHLLALKKAQKSYENLITERQESIDKLKESVEVWEKELKEAELSNKKARISSRVVQVLILNIIEGKTIIGDYNGATDYCDKLDIMPDAKKKYIKESENLKKFIKDEKLRNQ